MTDDIESLEAALTQRSVEISITVEDKTYREYLPIKAGFPVIEPDEDQAVMILASQVGGIALQIIAAHFSPGLLESVSQEFVQAVESGKAGTANDEPEGEPE